MKIWDSVMMSVRPAGHLAGRLWSKKKFQFNFLFFVLFFVCCLFFGFDTVKMINVRRDFLSLQETAVWAIVDHTTFSDLSFLSRLVRFQKFA